MSFIVQADANGPCLGCVNKVWIITGNGPDSPQCVCSNDHYLTDDNQGGYNQDSSQIRRSRLFHQSSSGSQTGSGSQNEDDDDGDSDDDNNDEDDDIQRKKKVGKWFRDPCRPL
ncbi:hypothetical protein TCAL_17299 [Tigriopus californicus]|uniref:Uncharacterized protein n=1 Tax=Tigriopus californicus TaxID=6832 RepID=A0A553NX73_TIGCA|nr:hypothetical protein TCAL_17299 [Tigriopus californicus]